MYARINLASCQLSPSSFTRAPESDHFKFAKIYVAASPLASRPTRERPCSPGTNSPQWGLNMPATITRLRWARCGSPEVK